jgi:hypothetical protein
MSVQMGILRSAIVALTVVTLALALALMFPLAAEALTGGPRIAVTTTPFERANAVIAADAGGGFDVAWQSYEQGGSDFGVYARQLGASLGPLSGEIPVNTTTSNNQREPAIATITGGGFDVAWQSYEQDGFGEGVYARTFDASGSPLSGEIAVNSTTANQQLQPAIAADPAGGFTVVWTSGLREGAGWDVYARRFDAAGEALSGEIAVNTITVGNQERPVIAPDGGGGFTVAWDSQEAKGSPVVVYLRRFDSSGAPITGEVPVDAGAAAGQFSPAIAAEESGDFLLAWGTASEGIQARRFDPAGAPVGTAFRVDPNFSATNRPTIAADPGGGFTVAWEGKTPSHVFVRRFDDIGTPLGAPVDVDAAGVFSDPSIASGGSGGFTVVWTREEEERSDVFARHFVPRPETSIDTAPADLSNDPTASFAFSADEYDSTFECRLDEAAFAPCASPLSTEALADGPHSFEVRATNPEEAIDLSPAADSFTVDTLAPETSLDSELPGLSKEATQTFEFSSPEEGATLECKLDFAQYAPCSSPLTTGPLDDGLHSFNVRARDQAGNADPSPAGGSFTIDTHAPLIAIEEGPAEGIATNDATPTFAFEASEQGTSFECGLDGAPASPCGSSFTAEALPDGPHVLSVWGTDEAGNTRLLTRGFTVDTAAPETTIDSGPASPTNDATPAFGFSSADPSASFQCSLDEGGFSPCASPLTLGPLPDGPHTFEARAVDQASNADPSPAADSFTVDTAPPQTAILSGPAGPTRETAPSFAFSSSEPGGFQCSLDGGGFSPCASPLALGPLPDGPHSLQVRAIDPASNIDPSPATRSFTVDTVPPELRVGRRKALKAGRLVVIRLSCAEPCSVLAGGRIIGPKKLRVGLRGVSRQLEAGQRETLRLRAKRGRTQRRLRRLLRGGHRARARVRIAATDAAGNTKTLRLKVGMRIHKRGEPKPIARHPRRG